MSQARVKQCAHCQGITLNRLRQMAQAIFFNMLTINRLWVFAENYMRMRQNQQQPIRAVAAGIVSKVRCVTAPRRGLVALPAAFPQLSLLV